MLSFFFTYFRHRKGIIYRKQGKAGVLGYWYSFFNFCITKLILVSKETDCESLFINSKQKLTFKRIFEQNEKIKMLAEILYLRLQNIVQLHSCYCYEKKRNFDSLWKIVKDFFYFQNKFLNKMNKTLKCLSEMLIFTLTKLIIPFSFWGTYMILISKYDHVHVTSTTMKNFIYFKNLRKAILIFMKLP